MNTVEMKNGQLAELRNAEEYDAKNIIDFYNIVGGETTFLSFCEGEYRVSVEQQASIIKSCNESNNNTMIIALVDDKIIGIGTISSNQKKKGKHVGILGIVIKKEYCNIGLGRIIMDYLIDWCKSNKITKKISLVSSQNNPNAIELYKKCGFEVEGILKNEVCIDGEFSDLVSMGLMI
ncbi:GNAT family N-acetyltransferase [Romboutsia sp.]|uniref:GNAT family N-acetyltransferase n=1 Tax=Romboutsia sp. TaxID=1965302 RepID=UPI003F4073B5